MPPQDEKDKKKPQPKKKEKITKEAPKEGEKKPVKLKKTSKKYGLYEIAGETLKRKNKFCPKCSEGVFLAKHNDRLTCGKCGYSEIISKEPKKKK